MRSYKFALVALACGLLTASAVAQHRTGKLDSIAGDWTITFTVQGQTVSGKLWFRVEGDKLSGTVETAHTGPGTLQGKWANNKLSATCVFEKHESIALAGELKDGKLSGTFHTEGRDGAWEATRAGNAAGERPGNR